MTATADAAFAPAHLSFGRRLRSIFGGSVGNLIEWYDWFAYASFSLYFAPVFFPDSDPTARLLNTAAIFGVGFLMRPVGGWLLGRYADRHGRKKALTLSVTMMCAGALLIAITPGYAAIGIGAPIMLVLARMLQGLSVGGEYGASATYITEMADRRHRGFWSSFQFVTMVMGQLLALGVLILLQATMDDATLESWGWRIPFFIGAVAAVWAFWLRRGIDETEAFKHGDHSGSLRKLMAHPRQVLTVFFLTMGGGLAFYAFTTYMQKYLVGTAGFTRPQATGTMALALFLYMLMHPIGGALSDRIGRRPMLIAFGLLVATCTVPLMTAIGEAGTPTQAFWLILPLLAFLACYTSVSAVFKAEMFPAGVRALGVGFPYACANAIFGGSAEYVALWTKKAGIESAFFWYVSACAVIVTLVALAMPDPKRTSQIVED